MESDWIIETLDKTTIVFKFDVIRKIISFKQHNNCIPESGGILIGRHIISTNKKIIVDNISTPQKKDKRSLFSFYRSYQHNEYLEKVWRDSAFTQGYLGLWHTHPEDIPNPSFIDKNDWKNSLSKDSYEGNMLIFVIVSLKKITCWSGYRNRKKFNLIGELEIT